jgi:hypothetical protein
LIDAVDASPMTPSSSTRSRPASNTENRTTSTPQRCGSARPGQRSKPPFRGEKGLLSELELGGGGLSYELAAVGLAPVASRRSHASAWSSAPVVFFVTDRTRALILQRVVATHGRGLDHDELHRPQFIIITACDVRAANQRRCGRVARRRPRRPHRGMTSVPERSHGSRSSGS